MSSYCASNVELGIFTRIPQDISFHLKMRKAEIQTELGLPRVIKWIIVARTGFEPKAVFLTTPYKCGMAKKAYFFRFITVKILKYI